MRNSFFAKNHNITIGPKQTVDYYYHFINFEAISMKFYASSLLLAKKLDKICFKFYKYGLPSTDKIFLLTINLSKLSTLSS